MYVLVSSGLLSSTQFCKMPSVVRGGPWAMQTKLLKFALHGGQAFARDFGSDRSPHEAGPKSAVGGIAPWVFATVFLLREMELAYITLDSQSIKLDYAQRTVSLHLSVQKNDPAARGVWRALACEWAQTSPCLCPFHVADDLVCKRLRRVGHTRLEDVPPGAFPLVGQCACPSSFLLRGA